MPTYTWNRIELRTIFLDILYRANGDGAKAITLLEEAARALYRGED